MSCIADELVKRSRIRCAISDNSEAVLSAIISLFTYLLVAFEKHVRA